MSILINRSHKIENKKTSRKRRFSIYSARLLICPSSKMWIIAHMIRNFLVLSYYHSHRAHLFSVYLRRALIVALLGVAAFLGAYSVTNAQTTTPEQLYGRCNVFVNPRPIGSKEYIINWQSYIQGVTSTTTSYSWSGTPATSAATVPNTSQHIQTEHDRDGSYQGTVTGSAGDQSLSLTCGAQVNLSENSTDFAGLSGSCKPEVSGLNVVWSTDEITSDPRQGTTTYYWSGSDGLSTTSQRAVLTYTTPGIKRAELQIKRGDEELRLSCEAYVSSTTGGCFIATAAFGTELQPEVQTLRKFRDEDLLTNKIGQEFVSAYYKVSPPIADYIRDKENIKSVVRIGLRPLIYMAGKLVN